MQFLTKDLETHRVASVTLAVLFVLLGIVALCLNIPYNFFEVDEAYQAFSIRHYDSSPLALLTFFLGHVWTQIFGDTFFALRTLCMLCYLTAIGTATIFYYRRTGNRLFATLLFMTGCLLANLAGFGIYNWDTGAYPVECFGAIASLRYLERPTLRRSLLCGVLFGLMVLFRLPLAAVVLIWICLTSWLRHTRRLSSREYIAQLLLPLLVMVIVTIAIAALILAGSGGFAGLSGEDSLIKGHGASSIMLFIARFKDLFPMVFNSFFYMVLALMLAVGVEFVKINRRTAIVISILILLTAGWSMIGHFVKFDNNDCAIFGLGYPFFFITVAAPWFMRSTQSATQDVTRQDPSPDGVHPADGSRFGHDVPTDQLIIHVHHSVCCHRTRDEAPFSGDYASLGLFRCSPSDSGSQLQKQPWYRDHDHSTRQFDPSLSYRCRHNL